jgi:DNA-binding GntR family transcriptional regulator
MSLIGPQPRYRQLAQTLINEIETGRYPVGDLLPTEFELCEQFGASRFTVREAIKQLVQRGLVDRQAGVGTRVKNAQPSSEYRQVMQRLTDLQRYSAQTELEIFDAKTIQPDQELCQLLRATPGQTWLRAEGVRSRAAYLLHGNLHPPRIPLGAGPSWAAVAHRGLRAH